MKNVLMRTPNALDGVSLYRHWGPMLELEKQGHVKLIAMNNDSELTHWHYYKKSHIAFCSRPAKIYDQAFVEECEKHGISVWVDIDDNLFELPSNNNAYDYFNETAKKILLFCLRRAKIVSVATRPLQDYLRRMFQIDATLIPNALDDSLLKYKKEFRRNNKILWRGSKEGERALRFYSKELDKIAFTKMSDWHFLGLNPYWLNFHNNWSNSVNYVDYIRRISNLNPSFCFMTHLNTEFDITKSTNGWLEATLVGSACLCPNIGDWVNRDIIDPTRFGYIVENKEDFIDSFFKLIDSNSDDLGHLNYNSMKFIENNLLLSIINEQRLKIINSI